MDAFTSLRKVFPKANASTGLTFLGPSQRIKIGNTRVELAPYNIGEDTFIMAAFVEEINMIFMRFEAQVFMSPSVTDGEED